MKRPMPMSVLKDLEYKGKAEDRSTPPRSSSPISETPPDTTTEPGEAELEIEDETKVVDEKELSVSKKQKIEEEEKEEKKEDEKDKRSEDMVNDDSKGDTSDEHDGQKDRFSLDLPELPATTQKLQHVTKGRARPNRRQQRKPTVKKMETDNGVDDFFNASVESTDFDKVPTLAEAKKEAEKEAKESGKTPKRQTGFALPGMGAITPEMLRRKKKSTKDEKEKEPESPKTSDEEKHEEKNGEAEEESPKSPEPAIKKKPPGAMGLPGMGFGSNVLAEMKLKKLQRTKSSDTDKIENGKTETESNPVPFGRGMLKKTNQLATSPVADKSEPNNNNSNNRKEWSSLKSSTPNRFKSRSFEKDHKPEVSVKSSSKSPLMPRKPTPPAASLKPGKGSPPPLPSKPKPTALRPDSDLRGSRPRPMSEFVDLKNVPSSVKSRARSWGKNPSTEDK